MLVQIINPYQFKVTISNRYILCTIKDGYATIAVTDYKGIEIDLIYDIEDINTLSQAVEFVYEEYTSGNLYKKIKLL